MIEHRGKVISVTDREVLVEIVSRSACSDCKAKALCSLSEQKEKTITLPQEQRLLWHVGEEVLVGLRASLGLKAVLFAYIFPLMVLLATLFTLPYFHISEFYTGLTALMAPLFCYFLMWLFRGQIKKEVTFVLKKLNPD